MGAPLTALDGIVLLWMLIWAIIGAGRGLVEQVLSLSGLAAGAIVGSRLAPALLPDGRESEWLPLVALAGALIGAVALQALLLALGSPLRRRVAGGSARRLDLAGGLGLGAVLGLALAWLAAAVIVLQPVERAAGLRDEVHRSRILRATLSVLPPDRLLGALARVDPFPFIPLPPAALPAPDATAIPEPAVRAAAASVVQVRGRACGVLRQGSGWVAAPDLVMTNAHVIAGEDAPRVLVDGGATLAARPVYVDASDDVAVLAVEGLDRPALRLGDAPDLGDDVVLLGYPGGGALRSEAATASPPRVVLAPDAYRRRTRPRSVVVTRGSLGPGSSGGPVIGRDGRVVAMIFGGSSDGASGAAVPPGPIRRGLEAPPEAVDSGPCA